MITNQQIADQLRLQKDLQVFYDNIFKWKWLVDKHNELLQSDYEPEEIRELMHEYEYECKNGYLCTWKYQYQQLYESLKAINENHDILEETFIEYLLHNDKTDSRKMIARFNQLCGGFKNIKQLIMRLTINGEFQLAKTIEQTCLNK